MHAILTVGEAAFSNIIVPGAVGLVNNYEKIDFGYNTLQAWCTRKANKHPWFFSRMDAARNVFLGADVVSLFWTGGHVFLRAINAISPYFSSVQQAAFFMRPVVLLSCGGLIGASMGVTWIVNKIFQQRAYNSLTEFTDAEKEQIHFKRPENEKYKQMLYVTRIILNIALVCLFPHNPYYILSALLEAYTLIKLAQRKWVIFKRCIQVPIRGLNGVLYADRIKTAYHFVLRDVSPLPEDIRCSICLDDTNPSTAVWFCDRHIFHRKCIFESIDHKMAGLATSFYINRREVRREEHSSYGARWTTYHANYELTVPQAERPFCPNCRGTPRFDEIVVKVFDVPLNKWSSTTLTWAERVPQLLVGAGLPAAAPLMG